MSLFHTPIQELKGVGEKRARLFQKLGAGSVGALLRFYPRAYEDLSAPTSILDAPLDAPAAVRAAVLCAPTETRVRGGMTLYKLPVTDGESDMEITFFNNPYVINAFKEGVEYLFYGKINANFLKRQMTSPEWFPADNCPPVRPIYRQSGTLSSRMIENAMRSALRLLPEEIKDPIPEDVRTEFSLCPLGFALRNIHFPADLSALELAKNRLIFEELLVLQLGLLRMKGRARDKSGLPPVIGYAKDFWPLLPFCPTNAQKRAVNEALADMAGASPMSRLVQGDVGSGKTAVAAALCHTAVKNGLQAALMAPTELLARQHYATLTQLLAPAGMVPALLTGSSATAEKHRIASGLSDGSIMLAVGTHALLSKGVNFAHLGLVITDEQHRFGVEQRAALAEKGDRPHMLVMSATPIPRTLALMIYGDLDISVLDELPPGRQKIDTYAIDSGKRFRAFNFLRKHISRGLQCYIICPTIDETDSDMASVTQYAARLQSEWLPEASVGALHGRLKPKEKEAVMGAFVAGKTDVLVSTTVVEVGVDVPNAVVIMIENADRYGLAQLHQLRGRVGRGMEKSTCILVSDAQNAEAVARLQVMAQTTDGFKIADEDLRLRGPGDFFGARQHGLPDLKLADMVTDMAVLRQAQTVARGILESDPTLEQVGHRGLGAEVRLLFDNLEYN